MMVCDAQHLATNSQVQVTTLIQTFAKIQLFQNIAMLRIKLKGTKPNNIQAKNGYVAYQIKGIGTYGNIQANILPLHTPSTHRVGLKGQNIFLLKVVMLHIKIAGRLVIHAPLSSTPWLGLVGVGWVLEVLFNLVGHSCIA